MTDDDLDLVGADPDAELRLLLAPTGEHQEPVDRALAAVLLALREPAGPDDLVGRDEALAAFETRNGARASWGWGSVRRIVRGPAALAVAGGVVVSGGMAAAAYTGILPDPVQRIAHAWIGAPDPEPRDDVVREERPTPGGLPTSPAAVTPPAMGPTPSAGVPGEGGPSGASGPADGPTSGGVPAPSAPVPPPPSAPVPSVPVPSVPVPSVPSLPVPSLPLPSVPSLPVPSLPVPSLPLPSVPSLPLPVPVPSLPSLPGTGLLG